MSAAYFAKPFSSAELLEKLKILSRNQLLAQGNVELELQSIGDARQENVGIVSFAETSASVCAKRSLIIVRSLEDADLLAGNIHIVVDDPRAVFIDLVQSNFLGEISPHYDSFLSQAKISDDAEIAPSAVVESGVRIDQGAVIGAGAVLKRGSWIGCNAVVGENVCIGNNGITRYRSRDNRQLRFPHLAGVYIGDNVEIGANCVIPQGMLSATLIERDSVLGNLCNIGHGVVVGEGVWMSVGCLIGGNSSIGCHTTLGMGVRVKDRLSIGEKVSVGMGSVVTKSVASGSSVFGNPARAVARIKAGPDR